MEKVKSADDIEEMPTGGAKENIGPVLYTVRLAPSGISRSKSVDYETAKMNLFYLQASQNKVTPPAPDFFWKPPRTI